MQTGAESRTAPKRSRGKWLGAALLLGIVATLVFWPRRAIRIPLSDGTALEIAAITTGLDHKHTQPLQWRTVLGQLSRGIWRWPIETIRFQQPRFVFWLDQTTSSSQNQLILIDRHGWRWSCLNQMRLGSGFVTTGPPIETDGPLHVEVLDGNRQHAGEARIPLAGDAPISKRTIEPERFPIHRNEGPLSVEVLSLQASVQDKTQTPSQAQGQIEIKVRWNDRPIDVKLGRLTLTDSLGRTEMNRPAADGGFTTSLSPYGTVWQASLEIFRGPDVPLELDEIILINSLPSTETPLKAWDGATQGIRWRATLAPPGPNLIDLPYKPDTLNAHDTLRVDAEAPVIVLEAESKRGLEVRIEPLDANGTPLPVHPVRLGYRPPNVWTAGCQVFDPAKGHTIRLGFNFTRNVNFAVRPEIVAAEPDR